MSGAILLGPMRPVLETVSKPRVAFSVFALPSLGGTTAFESMNLVYIVRCVFFGEGLGFSCKPMGIAKVAATYNESCK
jgi:hypothetical protein